MFGSDASHYNVWTGRARLKSGRKRKEKIHAPHGRHKHRRPISKRRINRAIKACAIISNNPLPRRSSTTREIDLATAISEIRQARREAEHAKIDRREMMIARHWRGWTKPENADANEELLREKVLPGLRKDSDYRGGYVFRSDGPEETEFVVVNLFDSIEAVRRFAGDNYTVAIFEPEAKLLLSRIEPSAMHYDVRLSPETSDRCQPTS